MLRTIIAATLIIAGIYCSKIETAKAEQFNLQSGGIIFRHNIKNDKIKNQKEIDAIIEAFDTKYKYEKKLQYEQNKNIQKLIEHKLDFGRAIDLD